MVYDKEYSIIMIFAFKNINAKLCMYECMNIVYCLLFPLKITGSACPITPNPSQIYNVMLKFILPH